MSKKDALHNEKRKNIYNYVQKHPGLHLRELSRKLGIIKSNLEYHLNYLIKQELIIKKKESKFSRYFVSNEIGYKKENLLLFARLQTAQDIILTMLDCNCTTLSKLSLHLNKSPTTIKFYLDKLLENEIIEPANFVEEFTYSSKYPSNMIDNSKGNLLRLKDSEIVNDIFEKYHDTLMS